MPMYGRIQAVHVTDCCTNSDGHTDKKVERQRIKLFYALPGNEYHH